MRYIVVVRSPGQDIGANYAEAYRQAASAVKDCPENTAYILRVDTIVTYGESDGRRFIKVEGEK